MAWDSRVVHPIKKAVSRSDNGRLRCGDSRVRDGRQRRWRSFHVVLLLPHQHHRRISSRTALRHAAPPRGIRPATAKDEIVVGVDILFLL
ncbi:unnamed protein product [Musa acuminata subsp. malaccensis]|uniref:(wild Malaysian banana) hypothetical protein n=1 Tax=Musa acuminata subsp. malaccensis TaxID=214687 RepID=A0A804IZ84_MUSAM|nr:unnamed protein product [Musa acuminata subsp. malaccensis]